VTRAHVPRQFLFDLDADYHELHNLNPAAPGASRPWT
jgi:hypothetical protein